jgi:hypothetical protein
MEPKTFAIATTAQPQSAPGTDDATTTTANASVPGDQGYSLSGVTRGGAKRASTTLSGRESPSQSHAAISP